MLLVLLACAPDETTITDAPGDAVSYVVIDHGCTESPGPMPDEAPLFVLYYTKHVSDSGLEYMQQATMPSFAPGEESGLSCADGQTGGRIVWAYLAE